VQSAERTADGVRVTLATKAGETSTLDVDVVLVAVGAGRTRRGWLRASGHRLRRARAASW